MTGNRWLPCDARRRCGGWLALAIGILATSSVMAQGARVEVLDPMSDAPDQRRLIVEALHRQAHFELDHASLAELMRAVTTEFGINVQVDLTAMDSIGLDTDLTVTLGADGLSLSSALRRMLHKYDMSYIVRDECLLLTTMEEAESWLETQVYPVDDLLLPPVADDLPLVPRSQRPTSHSSDAFDGLMELIENTIQPESWEAVGGPGTMSPFEARGLAVLVISQTTQAHEEIDGLLRSLRDAREQDSLSVDESDSAHVIVRVYPLELDEGYVPDEYAQLIAETHPDLSWEESEGFYVKAIAHTLVVKHHPSVQRRIGQLLADIGVFANHSPAERQGVSGFHGGGFGGGGGLGAGPPPPGGLF